MFWDLGRIVWDKYSARVQWLYLFGPKALHLEQESGSIDWPEVSEEASSRITGCCWWRVFKWELLFIFLNHSNPGEGKVQEQSCETSKIWRGIKNSALTVLESCLKGDWVCSAPSRALVFSLVCISLNFSAFLWIPLHFSTLLLNSLHFSVFLWISLYLSEFLYISLHLSEFLFISLPLSAFLCIPLHITFYIRTICWSVL